MFIVRRSRSIYAFHFFKFLALVLVIFAFVGKNGNRGQCSEEDPLLPNDEVHITLSDPSIQGEGSFLVGEPIEEIDYDPNLLKKVDPSRAQGQIQVILDFISLCEDENLFEELCGEYQGKESFKKVEDLKKHLLSKASEAFSVSPTLPQYLKERRIQSEALVDLVEKLLADRQRLLDCLALEQSNVGSRELLERMNKRLEEISGSFQMRQSIASSQESAGTCKKYMFPAVTFVVGLTIPTVTFFVYYWGHNH